MRVFLAGATGVIGSKLLNLLVADGHAIACMTRSPEKYGEISGAGALPVVCHIFHADKLVDVV